MKIALSFIIIALIGGQIALLLTLQQQKGRLDILNHMQDECNRVTSQIIKLQETVSGTQDVRLKAEYELLSTRVLILEQQQKTARLEAEINDKKMKIEALEKEILKK